ncbi:MAG: hypothetical protein E7136_04705 [Rikenellaceae bacterium]|nr:hypothetical protein [Rikenellaceae bacterium]
MKKFFRIFAVAALLCTTLVACEEKFDDYTPADPVSGVQAYFSNESATDVTVTKADSQVEVTLMRGDAMTAASVPITASIDAAYASLFNVPATANFETGKTSTSVVITFDGAQLTDGAKYQITLKVGDDVSTPYGKNQTTLNISVPEPYVLLGKGLYREDLMTGIFDVDNIEYEVEVYENLNTPGYLYVKNVYTSLYGYNDPGDYVTEDKYLVINVEDPNDVFLPQQELGLDWGYGAVKVATVAAGTLENNIITFPAKAFYLAMADYNGGGWSFYGNPNGLFRLCLPGAVLTDFSLGLSYSGIRAGADNSTRPVVDAVFGADVAEIQYAVVPGNVQYDGEAVAAAIAGMADESIVSATVAAVDQNEEDEVLSVELVAAEAVESGIYTMVAVPFDAEGNAQTADAAAVAFYVNSINTDVPEVDFKATMMSVADLFGPEYEAQYPSSSTVAWYAEGSNISAWTQLMAGAAAVQGLLDKGATLEQIVLANGSAYEDLNYINTDGYDYGIYNVSPETSYIMIHYVEDLYGNTKTVGTLYTTPAAEQKAEVNKSALKNSVKLEGGVSNLFE